jgi:hypothetical protein
VHQAKSGVSRRAGPRSSRPTAPRWGGRSPTSARDVRIGASARIVQPRGRPRIECGHEAAAHCFAGPPYMSVHPTACGGLEGQRGLSLIYMRPRSDIATSGSGSQHIRCGSRPLPHLSRLGSTHSADVAAARSRACWRRRDVQTTSGDIHPPWRIVCTHPE